MRKYLQNRHLTTIRPIAYDTCGTLDGFISSSSFQRQLESSVILLGEVISETEENNIINFIDNNIKVNALKRFRTKNYESSHWDKAISKYKELELELHYWDGKTKPVLERVQTLIERLCKTSKIDVKLASFNDLVAWNPPHIIDMSKEGEIYPHVDSIKRKLLFY